MNCPNSAIEKILFDELEVPENPEEAPAVFVVASPRTGSTLLYQIMAGAFRFPYISNLTNDYFSNTPIIGLTLQRGRQVPINMRSSFGKSKGPFQPSEGSAVLTNWFGGGHPSQIVSANILDGMEAHLKRTLAGVAASYGAPLTIKNPWNCFRIAYLAKTLPRAQFVWLRRDIARAAMSDLMARYVTKGDAHAWNSATPANYKELMKLPPAHQVVENQYEFNNTIYAELSENASGRWYDLWYEDLISSPADTISRLSKFLNFPVMDSSVGESFYFSEKPSLDDPEMEKIEKFVLSNSRLASYRRAGS